MTPAQGNLLAGRYRTIKRLGSGGMATVLLAEDERLGREVAVKRMHAESPEEVAKRFQREAQLGASLNHPNIVSIYDIETDDENVLIVMEYVPGGTLKDALARGPLPREAAFKVLRGVAAALDYAHEHHIIHRDVKPANVLLDADGRAKLADLGIATAAEVTSITSTGAVLGTASYMPPERLDGQPGGKEADIYGLATVAYETLTGRKARQGRSAVEIAAMVMSEPPPDMRVHVPEAPEEAARVLERGMARDPAARPESAGELVRELCAAFENADEEPEAATPLAHDAGPDTSERAPSSTHGSASSSTRGGASSSTRGGLIADTGDAPGRDTHDSAADRTPGASPSPTYKRQRAGRSSRSGSADRRWILPVAGLIAALLIVGLVLALSGGDDSGGGSERSDSGDVAGESQSGGSAGSSDGTGEGGAGGGDGSAEGGGSAPGAGGGAAPDASGGESGGTGTEPGGGSAGGADAPPAKAVSDFYTRAANDDFEGAWELAGPGVRRQLGGFGTFRNTLDTLESIEFPTLEVESQTGSTATVRLKSIAKHTNRTDNCTGTAETTSSGGNWKIERLNVDCG